MTRDASEGTSRRILRTAFEFCVRTVSRTRWNPVKHPGLRGHSDAHRCCGKSLMERALMPVGVRY